MSDRVPEQKTRALFNGQGDFCYDSSDYRFCDFVPPGCFIAEVSASDLALLKSGKAQLRADGTLRMR